MDGKLVLCGICPVASCLHVEEGKAGLFILEKQTDRHSRAFLPILWKCTVCNRERNALLAEGAEGLVSTLYESLQGPWKIVVTNAPEMS